MARRNPRTPHWQPTRHFHTHVVGTSFYRPALKALAQNIGEETAFALFTARLVLDDGNVSDSNAVAVFYEAERVGYLAASEAVTYRARLDAASPGCQIATVDALVRNGQKSGQKEYAYSVTLDLSDGSELSDYARPSFPTVLRLDPFQPLSAQADGSFTAPVWLGDIDLADLDKHLSVDTWTTNEWSKVNFYVGNRQGIGLGHKVYEMHKTKFETMFPNGIHEAVLLLPSQGWALLYVRHAEA